MNTADASRRMVAAEPRRVRLLVLGSIAVAALWAAAHLGLSPASLIPGEGGMRVAREFLGAALRPAVQYQAEFVPLGTSPLLLKALRAAGATVVFAAASTGLAVVMGLLLGFFASSAWWSGDPAGGESRTRVWLRRTVAPAIWAATRALLTLLRSIHELLWAVLFLAALGISNIAAVLAIAVPYSGILAKIFSEMIDETPRDAAEAMRESGASPVQVFAFGLVPRAVPDLIAYACYRFECALRSSAILGFFGFPTLGYYIAASFENLHYREVWTYVYTLFLLVAIVDAWSGAIRTRSGAAR